MDQMISGTASDGFDAADPDETGGTHGIGVENELVDDEDAGDASADQGLPNAPGEFGTASA